MKRSPSSEYAATSKHNSREMNTTDRAPSAHVKL